MKFDVLGLACSVHESHLEPTEKARNWGIATTSGVMLCAEDVD